jgi:UvrB/uvrC motif
VKTPSFTEHDATLGLWLDDPRDPMVRKARNELVRLLRARGWRMGLDPETLKQYRCIAKDHHRGKHPGGLEVKVLASGRHLEIVFFQNVANGENRHGGEYDFDRWQRMPYLIRLRYETEVRAISRLFTGLGLPDLQRVARGRTSVERILNDRAGSWHGRYWEREGADYNVKTPDGGRMVEGAVGYVRQRGRWVKGTIMIGLNNCHAIALPDGRTAFAPNHDARMTPPDRLKGRSFDSGEIASRLKRLKDQAIKAEQFERAAVLRDLLAIHQPPEKAAA